MFSRFTGRFKVQKTHVITVHQLLCPSTLNLNSTRESHWGAGIISAYGLVGSKATSSQKSGADVLSAVAAAAGTGANSGAAAGGGGGAAGFFARVQHVVVEFGPPGRWKVAGNTPEDGAAVLAQVESDYGFEPRLIDSLVRNENGLLFLPLCINMIIYQDWLGANACKNVASTKAHHPFTYIFCALR